MSVHSGRWLFCALSLVVILLLAAGDEGETQGLLPIDEAPATLHETGLYLSPGALVVDPAHLGFAPQYALWTDAATKRRWISVPPGDLIDASNADHWDFPIGTRFWKEFSFGGRPVETRFMQRRRDGTWLFATYAWNAEGTTATLVPARGILRGFDFGDGTAHAIPSLPDCHACHLSGRSPVLGFSALQLSDDRDPNALHSDPAPSPDLRLSGLVQSSLVSGLDPILLLTPPRISTASATQRSALGYLHGNCGHCHNPSGPLNDLGLYLRQNSDPARSVALATTFGMPLVKPPAGLVPGTLFRIAPGDPAHSAIPQRMGSRSAAMQMPPIGTTRVDTEAVTLINRWIAESWIPHASVQHNVSD